MDSQLPILGSVVSRRGFLKGTLGFGVLAGAATFGLDYFYGETAFADGPTNPIPSSGTAPEQVHMTWGSDPTSEMAVSWLAPGTVPMPAPSLRYSTTAISSTNPGTPAPLDYRPFADGANSEMVHAYHAVLLGLTPATTYHYEISDGATVPNTFSGSFTTAPSDAERVVWSFTSLGDISTPTADLNTSGVTWNESSDNAYFAVNAVESQKPLFHLLNGDLCYANLNYNSQPDVWRDFGNNIQRSASNRPWMPCLGNHEIEFGANGQDGTGSGIWNGPYGYGQYQTRFWLPENGVPSHRGNFYKFQVGTVLFISLDADDVIYQDGGSFYTPAQSGGTYANEVTTSGVVIPPGASLYNNQYTGALRAGPDNSLVPDTSKPKPNQQTTWLKNVLSQARDNPNTLFPGKQPVDMIVVQMHQCALSSSTAGNGSDLGLRQAWLPLFDTYGVDLVLSGHEHNYERSYAVRGYNPTAVGTVVAANPGQAANGSTVFTRQPEVVPSAQTTYDGLPAFDTSKGTVFLVLGGGGTDGPTNTYGSSNGQPQAKVITTRNLIYINSSGNYVKNGADSVEPAPWSAQTDTTDAYGYALFRRGPGCRPRRHRHHDDLLSRPAHG